MPSRHETVDGYLASLPDDRREAIEAIRQAILDNLDEPFEEGIQYGMIGYYLPHAVYPAGYHANPKEPLPFAQLASQKNHIALYLFCIYGDEGEKERFVEAWKKSGKRLDMGKSCVRVKKLEDVPLDVVGRAIERITAKKFVKSYEAAVSAGKSAGAKKAGAKKRAARKK